MESTAPLVQLRNISKAYGSVQALLNVDLDLYASEVLALVGDNGAGKSTLAKIVSGAHQPDTGDIVIDGRPCVLSTPLDAKRLGIEMLYQDLGLLENLSVAANVFLGREIPLRLLGRPSAWMDTQEMARRTRGLLQQYGLEIDSPDRSVAALSGGQRQLIAIARSALWGSRLIVLDEPTAALGVRESARVLDIVRQLRKGGVAVLVISHNLEHVFSIADRIAVLRRGRNAGTLQTSESTPSDVVHYITGAEFGHLNGSTQTRVAEGP